MKKFFSTVLAIAVIATSLPAYAAYDRTTYRNRVTELRSLIEQCKELGINTQNEEIDANVIATYAERIGDTYEGNVSSTITDYQLSELNTLYTNAKANLQGYIAGTKQAPAKAYSYMTGDNYQLDGKSMKALNGAPYFSIGFGHWRLSNYIKEFKDYGYDNVSTVVGLKDVVVIDRDIDNWDTLKYDSAEVTFDVYDDEGHSNDTSIEVINDSAVKSGRYGKMFQTFVVKPNTSYVISFYAKGTADSGAFTFTTNENLSGQIPVTGLQENSWKKITSGFTTGENEFFRVFNLVFNGICDVYIDDITIHKSGDSRNLIRNGGFDGDGHSDFDIMFQSDNTLATLVKTLYAAEKNNVHVEVLLQLQQEMPDIIKNKYSGLQYSDGRYNVDTAIAKEVERAYIEAIMGVVSDYSSLSSIILVNEPNYNTSHFTSTYNSKFATYLQNKHGTIGNLNSNYGGTSYSSFASVGIPTAFEATRRYYDWKNFNDSVFVDWYQRTVEIIKGCIPGIPVSIKTQPDFDAADSDSKRTEHMGRGANMELLAEYSDFHGNDADASYEASTLRGIKLKYYDYLNSISDKPMYNSENHITKDANTSTLFNDNVNKYIKNDTIQSAMHGLDMSSIWTWDLTTDSSNNRYGHLAMRPFALAELSKANLDINRFGSKVSAIANAQPDLAILRSDASRIYNSYYLNALHVAYLAALESGHKVGFVTTNNISSLSNYSTLVIPYATNVESNVINAINSFSGTIIMIGTDSLAKTEYNNSYSGDMLTKVNNIKNKAAKIAVTTGSSNKISAPTKATLSAPLRSGRVVTVTNNDNSNTDNIDWQYVPYGNGYLVNIDNQDLSSSKTIKVKINGSAAAYVTSLFDGVRTTNATLSLPAMTGGLYYVSNSSETVGADSWVEPVRKPQLSNTNDITALSGTRSGNVNTLTWKAQSYGKYNVYAVEADGSLEFIGSTYDETFEDTSTSAKTYAVKCVTSSGESNGKAITLGYTPNITPTITNNAGSSSISVSYENSNAFAVAVTITATAKNADSSFAGAAIVEQIIPAGKSMSYSKTFKTTGTGSITVIKK